MSDQESRKMVCLMYHQISNDSKFGKFGVCTDSFAQQVEAIKQSGIHVVDLASEGMRPGVVLTFDDGDVSNLQVARDLAANGLKAVFYILKNKSLTEEGFLKPEDIQEISKLGHTIGVHGKDHKWWTKKSPGQLVEELKETKAWIEELTGKPVFTCSAPGGRLDDRIVDAIREQIPGFWYIRNSVETYNDVRNCGGILNSVAVRRDMSVAQFRRLLTFDHALYFKLYCTYRAKEFAKRILGK